MTSRALFNALSSNTKSVRNLRIWNEIHLSIEVKLLGEDHNWKRNKSIGIKYP